MTATLCTLIILTATNLYAVSKTLARLMILGLLLRPHPGNKYTWCKGMANWPYPNLQNVLVPSVVYICVVLMMQSDLGTFGSPAKNCTEVACEVVVKGANTTYYWVSLLSEKNETLRECCLALESAGSSDFSRKALRNLLDSFLAFS